MSLPMISLRPERPRTFRSARMHWCAAAALLVCTSIAVEASAGDAPLAESLFNEGRALMESRDYAAACPKLPSTATDAVLEMRP